MNAPLPPNGDVDYNCKTGMFAEASGLQYITASTQTPPEFALPEDELLPPGRTVYPSILPTLPLLAIFHMPLFNHCLVSHQLTSLSM